jgi:hypothetical protein
MPKRVLQIVRDPDVEHSYLWCKTVTAVNLNVHCFHSLVGHTLSVDQEAVEQELVLPEAPAWYLCGVTRPYRWALNSHVLLLPDPDAVTSRTVITPALYVTMWGLRAEEITDQAMNKDRYGNRANFVTCRNLQAAHLLRARHGFPEEPRRARTLARQQRARAGLE